MSAVFLNELGICCALGRDADSVAATLFAADAPRGALVIVQEIFGVNHHIRAVTDKFAADGYLALAPCFFDHIKPGIELGYTPDTIAEGRGYVMRVPLEGGGRLVVELNAAEVKELGDKLIAAVP